MEITVLDVQRHRHRAHRRRILARGLLLEAAMTRQVHAGLLRLWGIATREDELHSVSPLPSTLDSVLTSEDSRLNIRGA